MYSYGNYGYRLPGVTETPRLPERLNHREVTVVFRDNWYRYDKREEGEPVQAFDESSDFAIRITKSGTNDEIYKAAYNTNEAFQKGYKDCLPPEFSPLNLEDCSVSEFFKKVFILQPTVPKERSVDLSSFVPLTGATGKFCQSWEEDIKRQTSYVLSDNYMPVYRKVFTLTALAVARFVCAIFPTIAFLLDVALTPIRLLTWPWMYLSDTSKPAIFSKLEKSERDNDSIDVHLYGRDGDQRVLLSYQLSSEGYTNYPKCYEKPCQSPA